MPGGGLAPDGTRWIGCRDNFFLPVKVLSSLFRGKFLAFLDEAAKRGELRFAGSTDGLTRRAADLGARHSAGRSGRWLVPKRCQHLLGGYFDTNRFGSSLASERRLAP
jgi:hypothetical protein